MKFLVRLRALKLPRSVRLPAGALTAIIAGLLVSSVTIDLGPGVRSLAEREGSRYLKRPLHIGSLRVRLVTGRVEVGDFSIEGLTPSDRPFFVARHLSVSLSWFRLLSPYPELVITSAEMDDWQMLVEKFNNGDNFPRFPRSNNPSSGPRRFRTTLQYFHASNGQFAYEDHELPWSVLAPQIAINITNFPKYHGDAAFKGGLVTIQKYVPMWADFNARFTIDGSLLTVDKMDMVTDGAVTTGNGVVQLNQWPEQTYQVTSRVEFPRMRELFFEKERWNLSGAGDFKGVFHLFKGGHNLSGDFTSEVAGLNDYRFPSLYGSLEWTRSDLTVRKAGSRFLGGDAQFDFVMAPLGAPTKPTGRLDARYQNVNLAELSNFYALAGLRMAGAATGRNLLEWPMGRFSEHRGEGEVTVAAPPGVVMMTGSLDAPRRADADHTRHEWGPFAPLRRRDNVPIAGHVIYRYGPDTVHLDAGEFATEKTHVTFSGDTAWGDESNLRFHVTSADWQESDETLAGILTDFGARTGPVPFGGRGEFDGGMTGPFKRPRVEGVFAGEDMRAWDTLWGDGTAHLVVENSYVTVRDALVTSAGSEIRADGLFSLGYPRKDGGDEIDARFRVTDREIEGVRHAFELDDWPVTGKLSGEFHLTGEYQSPFGYGAMTVNDGVAYGEHFEKGAAGLRFDGEGIRLDGVTLSKSSGTVTGAAYIGWDGAYSFNADGRRIPAAALNLLAYPKAQPTGLVEFTASGSSTFENPRYDVRFRMNDFAVADEPVGLVTGTLALRGEEVNGEIEVSSPRLAVTGTGRIALDEKSTGDLTFRFHDSSLDPYVRLFVPKLSPYTTAVANGTVRVTGTLADADHLVVDATVDRVDMTLFDYAIRNARPIRLTLDQNVVRVRDLQLVGDDTQLTVSGTVGLREERIALRAAGDANLGILQGFFGNVRGSGRAALSAAIDGPLYEPVFSGSATISGGRIRHFSLPNALDDINGTIRFDSRGARLDDVAATMGGGRIQFGGLIGLSGYMPGELNVSIRGEDMRLRYPEGIRSTVDADLSIRGSVQAPTLGGVVVVRNAIWNRRIDPSGGLLDFGGSRAGEQTAPAPESAPIPLRFDVEVQVPSTLRIENNLARLVASADLQLRGTYERPLLFGRAEVDRGEVIFEGRRYVITRGNIDFTNPSRIEPFLDLEAETRVRVPGQTYQVTVRALGTVERLQPELSSDPPLPAADVLALLFSDVRRDAGPGNAELRALQSQNRNEVERDLIRTRATQLLTSPVSAEVGRLVEQTFGVDSFQLTPSLIDPYAQSTSRVNPSARVTIGKRVSDRVYLTYSRSLSSSSNDQILLIEYDESDRLSWILSRNEDSTYAIEVRVRHTF